MYKYKQNPCLNPNCILKFNTALQPLSSYFNCKNYHGSIDQSRDPKNFIPLFIYSSNDPKNPFCNNIFEYLYHPSIYQTKQCIYKKNDSICNLENCPYSHLESIHIQNDGLSVASNNEPTPISSSLKVSTKRRKELQNQPPLEKSNSFTVIEAKSASLKFYTNQQLDLIEDAKNEFKMVKQLKLDMITNYICAFLNSRGGDLYIGVTNDGRVRGIIIYRQDIDLFQIELDRVLRRFDPCVLQEQIYLYFHPVYKDESCKIAKVNCYVIQIHIISNDQFELYFTHERKAFVKRAASINELQPKEIKAYVKQRTIQQLNNK